MPLECVGYRRLYEALGVRADGEGEFVRSFSFPDGMKGVIRLTGSPKYGIVINSGSGYYHPYHSGEVFKTQRFKTPQEAGLGGRWFTEVLVTCDVEVSESASADFRAGKESSHQPVFGAMKQLERDLQDHAELLAAFAGLRFHRQLVLRFMAEDQLAFRGDTFSWRGASDSVEMLDGWKLPSTIPDAPIVFATGDGFAMARTALPWFVRAWSSRDPVTQLLALFIPLEVCLGGIEGELDKEKIGARDLLSAHLKPLKGAGARKLRAALGVLLGGLRPSLVSRFELLARSANMPEWEKDVRAIRHFNDLRNDLIHRGNRKVSPVLSPDRRPPKVSKSKWVEELEHLEDIVERYVSFRLFGDTSVYPSRWRAKRARSGLNDDPQF